MKSVLIIGLGDFGHHLCRQLLRMNNEVMLIDQDEDSFDDLKELCPNRLIADCTSKSVLEQIGVDAFDICFVCIGTDFRSNLIVVSTLRELGAKYVVSETDDEMLEKLLLSNGANEVIHPNKDSASRAAVRFSDEHIFDYVQLKAGYSIYEITPIKEWMNKSILDSQIRARYNTSIIGINGEDGTTNYMPNPTTIIRPDDKLLVLAHENTISKLLKKM